jgi:hypothetical protein
VLKHVGVVVRSMLGLAIAQQMITVDRHCTVACDRYVLSSQSAYAPATGVAHRLVWLTERLRRPADGEEAAAGGQGARTGRARKAIERRSEWTVSRRR